MAADLLHIEVVYALAKQQTLLSVNLPQGTCVREAIIQSGILQRYPEIDLETHKIGIFSRVVTLDQQLSERDRIEIYRPLKADPKDARRTRAAKKS